MVETELQMNVRDIITNHNKEWQPLPKITLQTLTTTLLCSILSEQICKKCKRMNGDDCIECAHQGCGNWAHPACYDQDIDEIEDPNTDTSFYCSEHN